MHKLLTKKGIEQKTVPRWYLVGSGTRKNENLHTLVFFMNVYDFVWFEQHSKQATVGLTNNKSDYLSQHCNKQRGDQSKGPAELKRKTFTFDMYLLQPGIFCKSVMQARDADPHLIT